MIGDLIVIFKAQIGVLRILIKDCEGGQYGSNMYADGNRATAEVPAETCRGMEI